jgi:hypothetical protein
MSEPTFEIVPGVRAKLVPGSHAGAGVRWVRGHLCVGVAPTHPAYRAQVANTVGSSTDGVDEWRFRQDTGEMVSAFLGIPSIDAAWDDRRHVLHVPLLGSGALVLLDRRLFLLPQTMIGAFDPKGSALICLMTGTEPMDIDHRVEILPDVFVLLSSGHLRGWALANPTAKMCLPGEELLPLPTEELDEAREPLAKTLTGLFALYSDDEDNPVTLDGPALQQRLEDLGAELSRHAPPAASRALMGSIEQWLRNEVLRREPPAGPQRLARARNRKSGKTCKATDEQASRLARRELHPLLRARAETQENIVRLHRHLRWPEPRLVHGKATTTAGIAELLTQQPHVILDLMAEWNIPREVTGLATLEQLARTNDHIAACESQKPAGQPLRLVDWLRIIDAIGVHAEVKAVHDALSDDERRWSQRKGRKPPGEARGALAAIQDLELSLRGLHHRDSVAPRCAHCRFITHGVEPAPELKAAEMHEADQ